MTQKPTSTTDDDRRARHEARIDRLALGSMPALWTRLADFKGRPLAAVRELNPDRDIASFPRISELKWLHGNGKWVNLGSDTSGSGMIELVMWLAGGCERAKAVEFLEQQLAMLAADAA